MTRSRDIDLNFKGCTVLPTELHLHRFQALGGPCAIHLYSHCAQAAAQLALLAETEVRRIHNKYSRYLADSVISQINASAGQQACDDLDEETSALLNYAALAWEQSDGLFDISSGVLRKVWDFKAGRPPSQSQIDAILPLVGWDKVDWAAPRLCLPQAGMELDFGGIGKEYAVDCCAAILRKAGVSHGLVDLSGDICILGPHPDGAPWQVGIQHPRQPGAIAHLPIQYGAVASSGDYERSFSHQGQRYSHVLNPKTGWPVDGLASVSVVSDNCLIAGTACTSAMLLGRDAGLDWLRQLGLPFLAVDAAINIYSE